VGMTSRLIQSMGRRACGLCEHKSLHRELKLAAAYYEARATQECAF
jgi:hypothetical protein